MSKTIQKLRTQTATAADLKYTASSLETYARHVDSLQLDKHLLPLLASPATGNITDLPQSIIDRTTSTLQRYNPDLDSSSLFGMLTPQGEQAAATGTEIVTKYGIQGSLNSIASGLRAVVPFIEEGQKKGSWQATAAQVRRSRSETTGSLVDVDFIASNSRYSAEEFQARLERICFISPKTCKTVTYLDGVLTSGVAGVTAFLTKGLKLAQLAFKATAGGINSAAWEEYATAVEAASEADLFAAGALEAIADLALAGPEAVLLGGALTVGALKAAVKICKIEGNA